jgi:hypothetical protein
MKMKFVCFAFLFCMNSAFGHSTLDIPLAYKKIAGLYGIPEEIFFSMGLQESGKTLNGKFIPWPWTLNINEKGYQYKTRYEAEVALMLAMYEAKQRGEIGRVAVGIGQIYMPAHHDQFVTPLQALDPTINLHYAARLLATHYIDTIKAGDPDWWVSVGRYHSPYKEQPAIKYRHLVFKRCVKIYSQCEKFGASMKGVSPS